MNILSLRFEVQEFASRCQSFCIQSSIYPHCSLYKLKKPVVLCFTENLPTKTKGIYYMIVGQKLRANSRVRPEYPEIWNSENKIRKWLMGRRLKIRRFIEHPTRNDFWGKTMFGINDKKSLLFNVFLHFSFRRPKSVRGRTPISQTSHQPLCTPSRSSQFPGACKVGRGVQATFARSSSPLFTPSSTPPLVLCVRLLDIGVEKGAQLL